MDRYKKLEKIGQGSYGIVYKAQDNNGVLYALKKIQLEQFHEGLPSAAIREISLLKDLHHPNIVKIYTISEHSIILYGFLDQDLKKLLDVCHEGLDPTTVKSFMYQLLHGIAFCHHHCVLHRDLKPQNLLINREGFLKLADFGLARAFGIPVASYTHQVVTLWYRAPDVLMGSKKYSTAVDIWSVGCIFAELINGYPLFPGTNDEDQLLRIFQVLGTPSVESWPQIAEFPSFKTTYHVYEPQSWTSIVPHLDPLGIDVLSKMFHYNPDVRITAAEAFEHPYFKDLHHKKKATS